ncbi:phosphate ABC transporter permease subunit PstC, partial [Roseisolibacter sp. H3M3-2]|uniref:phosphate ABC transporter permease subunit PstC n=1 Tax=Roseisolibacter sp. H3M3-2 TaxID=3031323 RepID=UPI0023D9D705
LLFRAGVGARALCVPLLLAAVAWPLALAAAPALALFGAAIVSGGAWDPVRGEFGLAAALAGTLLTAGLALLLATPLALATAVYTAELAPRRVAAALAALADLLAAVPGVVYGLWGLHVLVPALRTWVMPLLRDTLGLGGTPFFRGAAYGPSLLAAALVLALMITPFIAVVAREVLRAVPDAQREAALALGATRWEAAVHVVLPSAAGGIVGGVMLGLGRALGETIAVALVVGGRHELTASLLSPGYTLAALVANEFAEASDDLHLSALMAAGLLLFVVTLAVNAVARWLVRRVAEREAA